MKYITFEHLSNSPQLSFLFVLKQKNQKETNKALDKLSSTIPNNSNQIKIFKWWFKCESTGKHEVLHYS
jgi:mannitol/fructose-specific phosphotransferase system IIA component (Ntr-type)